MKQQLIEALQALAGELRKNGKQQTADFFIKAGADISSERDENKESLLELFKRLQTSGAMVQYADFTAKEEKLWNRVHDLASELLNIGNDR